MKIVHIYHSGFLVEYDKAVLIFDYYKGSIPVFDTEKRVYFFASHVHPDHFNFQIFELAGAYRNVRFLLSHDIHKKYNAGFFHKKGVKEQQYDSIRFLKADEQYEDELLTVRTVGSTDAGVAFLVKTEGTTVFHAGDLNWWSWEGESDQNERLMEQRFRQEVSKLTGEKIDAAFLPLDGRQKDRFYLGFDYYMRTLEIVQAYPMHYWEDATVISRLCDNEISDPYRGRIIKE